MSVSRFEVGVTYYGRSICDSEAITHMTVIVRTRCTIRVTLGSPNSAHTKAKSLRVYDYNGVEHVRPNGRYSMALTIGADRPVVKCRNCATVHPFPQSACPTIRSEEAVRRAVRAHASGANLDEIVEAITMEGDTVTVECLKLSEVEL